MIQDIQLRELIRAEVAIALAQYVEGGVGIKAHVADPRITALSEQSDYAVKSLWKMSYTTGIVTFSSCVLPRGVLCKILDGDGGSTLTYDMTAAGAATTWYLGVQWDTMSGYATIIGGATLASIIDQTLPDDGQYVKAPICKLVQSCASWKEAPDGDYRHLLIGVLYT